MKIKQRKVGSNWKTQLGYYLMIALPVMCIILLNYVPMFGVYLGFIDYKPAKGIWGSKFVGLAYFKQFFTSYDFVRVFRNTLGYNLARILLVNLLAGMVSQCCFMKLSQGLQIRFTTHVCCCRHFWRGQ